MHLRDWVQLVAISFVVAFLGVFGSSYVWGEGWPAWPLPAELGLTVTATVVVGAVVLGFTALFARADRCPRSDAPKKGLPLPVLGLIMLVCWLPWLIANFPGSSNYDTVFQIYQFCSSDGLIPQVPYGPVRDKTLVGAWLVDHHPWLTSIIFGFVAQVSDSFTGTWMIGFFVFSTVQTLAYIALFLWVIHEFRGWGVPRGVRIAIFVVLCVVPIFPMWASCIVKDSLFGVFFLAWFILMAKAMFSKGESLTSVRAVAVMAILALMVCLTKKTGVYIVVITAVVACIWFRHQRGAVSALSAFAIQGVGCALVMFAIVPLVVFPALDIVPGGRQEALGTIFQQTARYAQDNALTPEEEEIIDKVIPIEVIKENYVPGSQDEVKSYCRTHVSDEELVQYLQLYAAQGLADPEAYFASLMSVAGIYFTPTTPLNLRMITVDAEFDGKQVLWNPSELDGLRLGLEEAYITYAAIPVLNLPVLSALWVLWLPALLLFVNVKQHKGLGLLFIPLAVALMFCVIGPVYDARYAWGIILGVPVLFGMMFGSKEEEKVACSEGIELTTV